MAGFAVTGRIGQCVRFRLLKAFHIHKQGGELRLLLSLNKTFPELHIFFFVPYLLELLTECIAKTQFVRTVLITAEYPFER